MWFILIILAILLIYYKIFHPYQFWKKYKIPYTTPWPIFGHMAMFSFGIRSLSETVKHFYDKFPNRRYFGFYQFFTPTLVLRDIDLIKQIAIRDFEAFIDRRQFISPEIDPMLGKSLFALTGQTWKQMRSTLSPAFSGSKMRRMFMLMSECAERFTEDLKLESGGEDVLKVELKDIFSRYTNDVFATCAFGIECNSLQNKTDEFYLSGKELTDMTGIKTMKFFGFTISPTFMKLFSIRLFDEKITNFFRNIVTSTMKIREENNVFRPDMIQILMEVRKGNLKHEGEFVEKDSGFATLDESEFEKQGKNKKRDWDLDEITAQALFFFFAGFETSSSVVSHMANALAMHEDVQKKLQEEVDATLESCDGKLTYEAVLKMKYMDMVLNESMRKWPTVPFVDRNVIKPYVIEPVLENEQKLVLEKKINVWIPIYAIHNDPNNFPNPEVFDPERFSDENKGKIKPFSFLPFGIGPRGCIGSRFALLESKTLFVYLLSKFSFTVVKETQIPLKHKMHQFNLLPANGFWVGLKLRGNKKNI